MDETSRERADALPLPLTGRLFPLKGERIPAQGKLVRERRPGAPIKKTDLPCKGNGTVNTQFPLHCLNRITIIAFPCPFRAPTIALNRNPGWRSMTRWPWAGIRIPFREKTCCLIWYRFPRWGTDDCHLCIEYGSDESVTARTIPTNAGATNTLLESGRNPSVDAVVELNRT